MPESELTRFLAARLDLVPRFQARVSDRSDDLLLRELLEELSSSIEELRVAEEELRSQNESLHQSQVESGDLAARYQAIFANLPTPVLITDAAGTVREANRAATLLLGISEDALRGKPLVVFVPEAERREFRRRLGRNTGADGVSWPLTLVPRRGAAVALTASISALPATRQTVLVWSLSAPVPSLAAEGTLLDAALEAIPTPACLVDLDGTLLRWNGAAQELLDWPDATLGRPLPVRFPDHDGEPLLTRAAQDRVPAVLTRGDGTGLDVLVSVRPLGHGDEPLGTLVSFDTALPAAPAPHRAAAVGAASLLAPTTPGTPLVARLRKGIATGLHLGLVHDGTRLPSVRALAAEADADHRAVGAAYRSLHSEGLVEVRGRQGVFVVDRRRAALPELSETAGWVAGVITRAADMRVRVQQLPELVRRFSAATRLRCACMESVEDELVTLTEEFVGQWGMDAYPVVAGGGPAANLEQARGAQLIVTTQFHAAEAEETARALDVPVVVIRAAPEFTRAVSDALARGPLSVLATDRRYVERLQFLPGSEHLRLHLAGDPMALESMDPEECVLVTPAARKRLGDRRMRMLLAPSEFLSQAHAEQVAAFMVARNAAAPDPAG